MAYTDLTTTFILDKFFTYIDADNLAENDAHIKDSFAIEHNWNASTVDGTHKNGSILGNYISTTPVSTGTQALSALNSWTPASGLYNMSTDDNQMILQVYVSGSWRGSSDGGISGLVLFDGTNMRVTNTDINNSHNIWYQKF